MSKLASFLLLFVAIVAPAQSADWRTPAEISGYRTTPRYDETMAYLRRIAAAAPKQVKLEVFGKTGQGRELWTVTVSKDGVFDPAALHMANRPVVLIQNAIHAGEMDGKDASLALLREILITKSQAALMDRAVLVFIPIYNADGHERVGRYNRINQNGPEEMGWRATAKNLNLNRDYMKADAPETRAFLQLWNKWQPDFFIDNHVTDGADYAYDVTYSIDYGPENTPAQRDWVRNTLLPGMEKHVNASGHKFGPYIWLVDDTDPSKGMVSGQSTPRFATGYAMLRNRPGMLIEMHMIKDYRTRVTGNYEAMIAMFSIINRDADKLVAMNRAADEAVVAAGRAPSGEASFPLRLQSTDAVTNFQYEGFKFKRDFSGVSGTVMVEYSEEPQQWNVPVRRELKPTLSVSTPRAYIVGPEWNDALALLEAHGLRIQRTVKAWEGEVEVYRCDQPKWQEKPFEGRHLLSWPGVAKGQRACKLLRERMAFAAGSAVVPLDQQAARIAIHLLEPEGPDSLTQWGFFDAVFEQKEYGEGYVLEKLAREMMAQDPKLREEFERKLVNDKEFAADPFARLNWFYQRSPYWDRELGRIPVGRLASLDGVPVQ